MNFLNFLFALAVGGVLVGAGWPIVAAVDRRGAVRFGERLLFAYGVGAFLLYLLVYAVSPFRLDAPSMWGVLVVLCVVAAFTYVRAPWSRIAAEAGRLFGQTDTASRLLLALVVVTTMLTLLQGLAPPNDYDSLMYHLAFPQLDLEHGRRIPSWRMPHAFFPALMGHQTRLALAIIGPGAAQVLHGILTIVGGGAVAALVLRLGGRAFTAVLGAFFFITIRMVIWQMGTVEVDAPLAAFAVMTLLAYTIWREKGGPGIAALFGLMVGCTILVKYTGFAFALAFGPLILFDAVRWRHGWRDALLIGPAVAALVIAPHAIRNFVLSGNPVFPILNAVFNPTAPDMMASLAEAGARSMGVVGLLTAPWKIFVLPTHVFDGMMIGSPYLLAFAPLVLLDRAALGRWLPPLSVIGTFYVLWFYFLGHQVRFLMPALGASAGVAAAGLAAAWRAAEGMRWARTGIAALFVVLIGTQGVFWGAYAALRLPVVFGAMGVDTYLSKTPTMRGSYYGTCRYVREHLRPGERYLSFLSSHSYYCPQAAADVMWFPDQAGWWAREKTPPPLSYDDYVAHIARGEYRFVIVPLRWENRGNRYSKLEIGTIRFEQLPYGRYLAPVLSAMTPLTEGAFTAVYDGRELLRRLRAQPDPTEGTPPR